MLQEIWYFLQILKKQEDAYVPIEGLLGLAGPNLWVVATWEKSVGKVPKTSLKKGGAEPSVSQNDLQAPQSYPRCKYGGGFIQD